jgi:rRNA-processing protein FCF1
MNEAILPLINRYHQRGVLIDTNILLLYFVGSFARKLIPTFKRTKQFTIEDYQLLLRLIGRFRKHITTPNILTEVSNLSGSLDESLHFAYFQKFAEHLTLLEEHYVESHKVTTHQYFTKLGLTDAGIFTAVKGKYLVLAEDFPLSQSLQKEGIACINFNHIRTLGWSNR